MSFENIDIELLSKNMHSQLKIVILEHIEGTKAFELGSVKTWFLQGGSVWTILYHLLHKSSI